MAPSCSSSQTNFPPNHNAAVDSKVEMQSRVQEPEMLVGLKDETSKIIDQLIGGSRQRKILSIVGMPGIGKTTLANSVYKHPTVDIHFGIRAWYCLSQDCDRATLLSSILGQICQETNRLHEISREDLAFKVYRNLKGRRYLIVLDDIWDIESWNGLQLSFPDDKNGSRILFTTRSHEVASQAKSIPYALRLLSNEESCRLLWLKLFNDDTCPQELSVISKLIASSCKGLPLAVVLMAGILKSIERNKHSWEQVAESLISQRGLQEKILKILEASYDHLPDYLKPCFLYFGTFTKSTTVSVSKMIRLWIAEGFVHQLNQGQKSLKQVAERYLDELIGRSLVMIARRSSTGGVKACRIHSILQKFCVAKLEKERCVMRKAMGGGIAVLYGDFKMHKRMVFRVFSPKKQPNIYSLLYKSNIDMGPRDREDFSEPMGLKDLSLSEQVLRNFLPIRRYNLSEQMAMFWTKKFAAVNSRTSQRGRLDYDSILNSKNLGVLDLGNIEAQSCADFSDLAMISTLIHLKYLAVRIRTTKIPCEIGNLKSLETFHLSGAIGLVMLPESIWKIESLKDVIMDHCFFSCQHYSREFYEQSSQLENLKSISTIRLEPGTGNVEKFLKRLPGVQKLTCVLGTFYEARIMLELLCELESLKMSFQFRLPFPVHFGYPLTLKKLTVSNACLPWNRISVIGQLPNLEVLKLLNRAFEGEQWDMREGEFQKLKFLKLDSLDIVRWNATSEHLPCLEQLLVLSCDQLEEIPLSFGEITTLQLIEMKRCSALAAHSVQQILETQRDYSNDQLNVIVIDRQLCP